MEITLLKFMHWKWNETLDIFVNSLGAASVCVLCMGVSGGMIVINWVESIQHMRKSQFI